MLKKKKKTFIDEFYGKYYGPDVVNDMDELIAFSKELQHISHRVLIDEFIEEKCFRYGESLVNRFFDTKLSLVEEMEQYEKDLKTIYPNNNGAVSSLIKAMCYGFWEKFDFCLFSMDNMPSYQKMHFSDMRGFPRQSSKCGLVNRLNEIFKTAEKQNPNTVRSFRNKIEESTLLDDKSRKHLIQHFRKYCLDYCDKRHYIDFWLALGDLDTRSRFVYFFDNGVRILTSPDRFDHYIEDSEQLSDLEYLVKYREGLEEYRKNNDSREVTEILDIVKQYESEVRKEKKAEKKQEKKYDKKHLEHTMTNNDRSKKMPKHEDTKTKENIDFVTGSSSDKDEKKSKKPFNILGIFNRHK